jgi:hypothetical protein
LEEGQDFKKEIEMLTLDLKVHKDGNSKIEA